MKKNKFTGVLGSALACSVAEVVVNLIVYGVTAHLLDAAVVGLVLGAIVGVIIAAFGSDRPIFGGVIATAVVFGLIMAVLASVFHVTAVLSAFELCLAVVSVLVIGAVNGFGYSLLGPRT